MRVFITFVLGFIISLNVYSATCADGFPAIEYGNYEQYQADYANASVSALQEAHEVLHNILMNGETADTPALLEQQQVVEYFLDCAQVDADIVAAEDPITADFSGSWYSYWGSNPDARVPMNLVQNGVEVVGSYEYQGGRIEGTVTGNVLSGTWSQTNGSNGYVELTLNDNGTQFSGRWRYPEQDWVVDPWNGYR